MSAVVNPVNFTIGMPLAASESITGLTIMVGTTTGGPYTTHSYPLTAAEVAAGLAAGGTFTGTLASVGENLPAGTYFAVVTATNSVGTGPNSPEASFQVLTLPSAPVSFSVA